MSALAGTLADVITRAASETPHAPALIDDLGTMSFAELHRRIGAITALLPDLLEPGANVAVIGPNHRSWVELYYAIPESDRTLVFLNHRLNPHELCSMIERSRSRLVIGASEELDRLRIAGCEVPMFDRETWTDLVDGVTVDPPARSTEPGSPAWLLFTSGTTAAPKGALLSHASILAAVDSSSRARPVDVDDIYVFPFPLCHVAGYNVVHRHAHGRPVVLMSGFVATEFCDLVERHRVRSTSLAATMLATLADLLDAEPQRLAQLSSLRSIAYGAAPMPTPLLVRTDQLLGVDLAQGYGMTELSGNAVFLDAAAHRRGLESEPALLRAAGIPAPGVELRIVDSETEIDVASGQMGEILVRAPQVMLGYLDDEEATTAALRGGWLHTGDIGQMLDGVLFVTDRKKDIIITGGENVSSLEMEDVVLRHPGVLRAAVVGVPDATWGENVCAVLVVRDRSNFDASALVDHVRRSLAGFKVPRHVVIVDDLPLTASGKVVKAELRSWLAEHPDLLGPRL